MNSLHRLTAFAVSHDHLVLKIVKFHKVLKTKASFYPILRSWFHSNPEPTKCCKAFSKKHIFFFRLDLILHGHGAAVDLRDLSAQEEEVMTFSPPPYQLPDFFSLLNQCARVICTKNMMYDSYFFMEVLVQPSNFLKNRFLSSCQTDTDSLNAHQQKKIVHRLF